MAAAPDLVLIPERGLESVGGLEHLLNVPGLALTPAGQARRVVAMDDLYLARLWTSCGTSCDHACKPFAPASSDPLDPLTEA